MPKLPAVTKSSVKSKEVRFNNLAGGYCNLEDLLENQTHDCLNVLGVYGTEFEKRPGQARVFPTSLGTGKIHWQGFYRKPDGTVVRLIHHTTKLYTQSGANQPVEIYSGLADADSCGVVFNSLFFLIDGTNFIVYDGTTVSTVESKAYVPKVTVAYQPSGAPQVGVSETINEPFNYLSNSWQQGFSANGTATYFQLMQTGLTSIDKVELNGNLLSVGTHYTVDLALGRVIPVTPANFTAGTDNVQIYATKTGMMDKTIIKKNKRAIVWSNRIFLLGSDSARETVYWSGLTGKKDKDGYYWPEENYQPVGMGIDSGRCMAFAIFNNYLIVLKERSTEKAERVIGSTGTAEFHWSNVDPSKGCDMPGSVQNINGFPVFANSYDGVCIIRAILQASLLNIDVISTNFNGSLGKPGLLSEQKAILELASSVDWNGKYWLCYGSKAWVWDYASTPYRGKSRELAWWPCDNINASCFAVNGNELSLGDRTNGVIRKFMPGVLNDEGVGINAYYEKKTHFGLREWLKEVKDSYITPKTGSSTYATVEFSGDKGVASTAYISAPAGGIFIDQIDFDTFTFAVSTADKPKYLNPKVRNSIEFKVRVSNNVANQDLAVSEIVVYPRLLKKVR